MKRVAVIVRAGRADRVAEALRAALGLGLRGDRVEVVLTGPARPALADPRVVRALATLAELGQEVVRAEDVAGGPHGQSGPNMPGGPEGEGGQDDGRLARDAVAAAVRRADAVEVWT